MMLGPQNQGMPATHDRWQEPARNIEHMFSADTLASIKTAIWARLALFYRSAAH